MNPRAILNKNQVQGSVWYLITLSYESSVNYHLFINF